MAVPATHVWQNILEKIKPMKNLGPYKPPWLQAASAWQQAHPGFTPQNAPHAGGPGMGGPHGTGYWPAFGQPGSATVSAAQPTPQYTPSGQAPPGTIPINDGNGGVRFWNPVTQQFANPASQQPWQGPGAAASANMSVVNPVM